MDLPPSRMPTLPNKVKQDLCQKEMESLMRLVDKRPEALLRQIQKRRGEDLLSRTSNLLGTLFGSN